MGKENTGANHAQKRRNRLDHLKSSRCAPGRRERQARPHSQKDSLPESKIGAD
jgi:hypothetical protein